MQKCLAGRLYGIIYWSISKRTNVWLRDLWPIWNHHRSHSQSQGHWPINMCRYNGAVFNLVYEITISRVHGTFNAHLVLQWRSLALDPMLACAQHHKFSSIHSNSCKIHKEWSFPIFPWAIGQWGFDLTYFMTNFPFSSQLPVPIHMFSSFVPALPPMPPMPPLPVPLNAIHLPGAGMRNNQQTRKKTRRQIPKQGAMFNSQLSQQDIPLASISQASQGFSQSNYDGKQLFHIIL